MTVILERLTGAFALNCELFFLTLLFSLPLGLVVAFGSMSRCAPLRGVVKTFVWVIRGTPLMLQIIVIYLGPGLLGMTNPWPSGSSGRLVAACISKIVVVKVPGFLALLKNFRASIRVHIRQKCFPADKAVVCYIPVKHCLEVAAVTAHSG